MRIGILSMQRIYNYGSWLQAYGLKKMLENVSGESVEFVDYRIERPQYCNGFNWISYLKNVTKVGLIDLIASNRVLTKLTHNKQFEHTYRFRKEFWKKLGLTDKPNYSPELDLLVVGSDEVFNCFQENVRVGYSKELFAQNSRAKKTFTYAAPFGNTTMEKIKAFGKEKELAQWLSCFERISVRDSNSLAVVKGLLGGEVESNLDPVLMYDFQKEIANCSIPTVWKHRKSKRYDNTQRIGACRFTESAAISPMQMR